jgi:hypothetical protein
MRWPAAFPLSKRLAECRCVPQHGLMCHSHVPLSCATVRQAPCSPFNSASSAPTCGRYVTPQGKPVCHLSIRTYVWPGAGCRQQNLPSASRVGHRHILHPTGVPEGYKILHQLNHPDELFFPPPSALPPFPALPFCRTSL